MGLEPEMTSIFENLQKFSGTNWIVNWSPISFSKFSNRNKEFPIKCTDKFEILTNQNNILKVRTFITGKYFVHVHVRFEFQFSHYLRRKLFGFVPVSIQIQLIIEILAKTCICASRKSTKKCVLFNNDGKKIAHAIVLERKKNNLISTFIQ